MNHAKDARDMDYACAVVLSDYGLKAVPLDEIEQGFLITGYRNSRRLVSVLYEGRYYFVVGANSSQADGNQDLASKVTALISNVPNISCQLILANRILRDSQYLCNYTIDGEFSQERGPAFNSAENNTGPIQVPEEVADYLRGISRANLCWFDSLVLPSTNGRKLR